MTACTRLRGLAGLVPRLRRIDGNFAAPDGGEGVEIPRRWCRLIRELPFHWCHRFRRIEALALLALGCASGPYALLVARTPDRQHRIEIVEREGRAALVSDGRRGREFQAIVPTSLRFDRAGEHVAYAVDDAGGQRLALDHCTGPRFDGIGEIVFSAAGDRLAYAAASQGGWRVVVDGRPGPRLSAVFAGTLQFGRDGTLVYAAAVAGGARVFAEQAPGPLADGIAQLQLAADGSLGYVARRGRAYFVVYRGQLGPPEAQVGTLWVGAHAHAYAAWRAGRWAVLWNGRVAAQADAAPELTGSDDGQHVAWVEARSGGSRVWLDGALLAGPHARVRAGSLAFAAGQPAPSFIAEGAGGRVLPVIAGVEQPALDGVGSLVFSRDGRHFAYAGGRAGAHRLVVDGRERLLPGAIGRLELSPDGSRVAFVLRAESSRVHVDGREHRFGFVLADSFAFAADGQHWSVLAGDAAERSLYFAVDGERGRAFDFSEVISAIAISEARGQARPEADLLREWNRAMADAAGRGHVGSPAPPLPTWLSGSCAPIAPAGLASVVGHDHSSQAP